MQSKQRSARWKRRIQSERLLGGSSTSWMHFTVSSQFSFVFFIFFICHNRYDYRKHQNCIICRTVHTVRSAMTVSSFFVRFFVVRHCHLSPHTVFSMIGSFGRNTKTLKMDKSKKELKSKNLMRIIGKNMISRFWTFELKIVNPLCTWLTDIIQIKRNATEFDSIELYVSYSPWAFFFHQNQTSFCCCCFFAIWFLAIFQCIILVHCDYVYKTARYVNL